MKRSFRRPLKIHYFFSYLSIVGHSAATSVIAKGDVERPETAETTACTASSDALDSILATRDISISLRETSDGLTLSFSSENSYRREQIKQAFLDFLKQRALNTQNWGNNAYDLEQ